MGKPGLGKTTLACAVARELGRPVHLFQCTMDTRPEDNTRDMLSLAQYAQNLKAGGVKHPLTHAAAHVLEKTGE